MGLLVRGNNFQYIKNVYMYKAHSFSSSQFYVLDPGVQHLAIDVLDHDYKSDDFLGR